MAKLLSEVYPELYHYTGIAGLNGIIESQTLWATHYAYLNDAEEIRHFGQRLKVFLVSIVESGLKDLIKLAPKTNQTLIDHHGGINKVTDEATNTFINIMYRVLLGDQKNPPLAEPYITSFCTAVGKREKEHGLLSQWRGYGSDGGYAIVFDTKRFQELLKEESEKWQYAFLQAGDVLYSTAPNEKIADEIGEHIDDIRGSLKRLYQVTTLKAQGFEEEAYKALEKIYPAILYCSCRFKHWGFQEEKEVRIVAIPQSPEVRRAAEEQRLSLKPEKPKKHFSRPGMTVPYIDLFEGISVSWGKRLPITHIIVGPHPEKDIRRRAIEILLDQNGIDAEVSASEIPYLGR